MFFVAFLCNFSRYQHQSDDHVICGTVKSPHHFFLAGGAQMIRSKRLTCVAGDLTVIDFGSIFSSLQREL